MSDIRVNKIQGIEKDAYNEFQSLENFYKKFNKVLLDKFAIDKQKATLEKKTNSSKTC